MSVTQVHPLDSVEAAPSLPPLDDAMTEEQHEALMSEEQSKVRYAPEPVTLGTQGRIGAWLTVDISWCSLMTFTAVGEDDAVA